MKVIAKRSNIRMSPRKLRRVADVVRGSSVKNALPQLAFLPQRAADPLLQVLKQAIANASDLGLSGQLKISRIEINQGPAMKRFQPVSRGQAHSIKKFSSHIIMELSAIQQYTAITKASNKAVASEPLKSEKTDTAKPKKEVAKSDTAKTKKASTKKKVSPKKTKTT